MQIKHAFIFSILLAGLSGCSTSQKTLLPVDENTTMLSLWSRQTGSGNRLFDARSLLRRPLTGNPQQVLKGYTRTAASEITAQFSRLPDPDMVMYVYPHLTGGEGVPVPGYSTVFAFYRNVHYALPGERTEGL
ncbi:TIGR03751 family conjugal transfer lipoprotein [Buttiauxella selenatireducens]|uniref:TIGR03751 family conjugal transfer lipoprotein n=1 Tax=Buttiauxella selenatireducens TaxID=3073902 RepID=A0ABY9S4Q5_9ENTR|nr:TIGR03751 family conjugal transfer lipoprotein [Buttiauxella sp. R73]WMY72479.1 TIGR03751 family conjugal transfer lipoprotein [Buttiauxella sp. R73]